MRGTELSNIGLGGLHNPDSALSHYQGYDNLRDFLRVNYKTPEAIKAYAEYLPQSAYSDHDVKDLEDPVFANFLAMMYLDDDAIERFNTTQNGIYVAYNKSKEEGRKNNAFINIDRLRKLVDYVDTLKKKLGKDGVSTADLQNILDKGTESEEEETMITLLLEIDQYIDY